MTKWIFLAIAGLLAGAGLLVQYQNGQAARSKAASIEAADQQGLNTKTELDSLRRYVAGHMGASVKVTLEGSYERAQAAAQKAAADTQAAIAKVYVDAQLACVGQKNPVLQAKCNQDYVAAHPAPATSSVLAPQLADYQYDLRSPLWAPDLAGWLLLGSLSALAGSIAGFLRR